MLWYASMVGLICTRAVCSGLHVVDATHGKPAKSLWRVLRRLPQQDAAIVAVEIFSGVIGVHDMTVCTDCDGRLKNLMVCG